MGRAEEGDGLEGRQNTLTRSTPPKSDKLGRVPMCGWDRIYPDPPAPLLVKGKGTLTTSVLRSSTGPPPRQHLFVYSCLGRGSRAINTNSTSCIKRERKLCTATDAVLSHHLIDWTKFYISDGNFWEICLNPNLVEQNKYSGFNNLKSLIEERQCLLSGVAIGVGMMSLKRV